MNAITQNKMGKSLTEVSLTDFITDMKKLGRLIARETELLRAMKLKEVKTLHKEKEALIRKMEIRRELIKKDPEILAERTEKNVSSIMGLENSIKKLMKANLYEVTKARESNHRIVEFISNAIMKRDSAAYGKSGAAGKYGSTPAITLSETV